MSDTGFGNTFRKAINDLIFKNTSFTANPAGVVYVSLHTADPGPDGQTSNEVSGGSYAAKVTAATDWNAATAADPSVVTNANAITFVTATGSWGTVTHFGLWNHATLRLAANFVGSKALTASQAVASGNTVSFPAGSLVHNFGTA
jgi:hypothetical protein